MNIYAFGSVCRGDVDAYSDVDMLAITEDEKRFDPLKYSIYSPIKIKKLWQQGNPFSWHLYFESKLIYSDNGEDYIRQLGEPYPYMNYVTDCEKFYQIFSDACASLSNLNNAELFDLSVIFLSTRNIATCYSLGYLNKPNFLRNSVFNLGNMSIPVSKNEYSIFERARILSVRGIGEMLNEDEINIAKNNITIINEWILNLVKLSKRGGCE